MASEDRPPNVERLDWRLTELEKRVDSGFADLRANIRSDMRRIEGSVERLQFVDLKLYQSEQAAQNKATADLAGAMKDRMDRFDARLAAVLTLVIGAILAALAAGLVRLALG